MHGPGALVPTDTVTIAIVPGNPIVDLAALFRPAIVPAGGAPGGGCRARHRESNVRVRRSVRIRASGRADEVREGIGESCCPLILQDALQRLSIDDRPHCAPQIAGAPILIYLVPLSSAQVHRRKAVQLDGAGGGVCGSQNAGGVHYFSALCGGVPNPGYVIIG